MNTEVQLIPDFTKDDYLETSEPFLWLYQFHSDPFMQQQMLTKIKSQAAAVGISNFVALWKSFLDSLKTQRGQVIENATDFTGQPMELICGKYICDDAGVRVKDAFGYDVYICPHPVMPIKRLVNIDDGQERLEIAYRKGKTWRSIIAEKSTIASSSSILQLAAFGVLVNSENAKQLSTYILSIEEMNYDEIPEEKSVGRLGWVLAHGFAPYFDSVVFDGEANFKHIFNSVHSAGDYEVWKDAIRKVRAEKTPARIAIASSFASVLLEPLGLLPFFTHIWGSTECGKSVMLLLAASVWACPKFGEYVFTFNSTGVGQELTAAFLNSLPMCMDELQLQSSAGIKDFDKMVYALTEGVGRTRGAKTGGLQRQNRWRCCFITNGEHPLNNVNSAGGAVNRIIDVEVTEKIYHDLIGLCAIINENYGFAGREFIAYLQSDGALERVNDIQKEFYRELLKSDSTDKQAASASAILAADKIATELIFHDDNALTVEDMAAIMTKKDDVNVNRRALEYIYELVARNPMHFSANEYGEYKSEVWGKKDTGCIYFVKSVFDREMSLAGFNSSSFLAWAKRQGILDTNDERRTKRARIAGSVLNTVCLKADWTVNDRPPSEEDFDDLPL